MRLWLHSLTRRKVGRPKWSKRRITLSGLLTSALIILILHTAHVRWWHTLEMGLLDGATFLGRGALTPLESLHDLYAYIQSYVGLRSQVEHLTQENYLLRARTQDMERLIHENTHLKQYVDAFPGLEYKRRTVQIIAWPGGVFSQSLIIGAGVCDGVRRGQVVLDTNGVLGRVVEMGCHSARVLLATDLNSNIPITIVGSEVQGIVNGQNGPTAILKHTSGPVQVGDHCITSAYGGVFPLGLPVGVVTSIKDGIPHVQLSGRSQGLTYVQLLGYQPIDIADDRIDEARP